MNHEEVRILLKTMTKQVNDSNELLGESQKNTEHFQNKCKMLENRLVEVNATCGALLSVLHRMGLSDAEIKDRISETSGQIQ